MRSSPIRQLTGLLLRIDRFLFRPLVDERTGRKIGGWILAAVNAVTLAMVLFVLYWVIAK